MIRPPLPNTENDRINQPMQPVDEPLVAGGQPVTAKSRISYFFDNRFLVRGLGFGATNGRQLHLLASVPIGAVADFGLNCKEPVLAGSADPYLALCWFGTTVEVYRA
jgi:hypothetical protein